MNPRDMTREQLADHWDKVNEDVKCEACAEAARRLREPVPKGHVLCDDGVVRKVTGELPITADKCLVGGSPENYEGLSDLSLWALHPKTGEITEMEGTPCWTALDDWRVAERYPVEVGRRITFPVSWCYSTREAAEAARTTAKEAEHG